MIYLIGSPIEVQVQSGKSTWNVEEPFIQMSKPYKLNYQCDINYICPYEESGSDSSPKLNLISPFTLNGHEKHGPKPNYLRIRDQLQ